MTQPNTAPETLAPRDESPADAARDQASKVAGTAADRAGDVAGTAKDQASQVVGTAKDQAQQLLGQAGQQLDTQAGEQSRQLSSYLKSASKDFQEMATSRSGSSPAQSLVDDLGQRSGRLADYLERTAPRDMISDLQDFGRRRPAAFLAGAAVAGLIAGRLGKSVKNAPETATAAGTGSTTATGTATARGTGTSRPVSTPESAPVGSAAAYPAPGAAR